MVRAKYSAPQSSLSQFEEKSVGVRRSCPAPVCSERERARTHEAGSKQRRRPRHRLVATASDARYVDAGASLTRAPTVNLTCHISVEALCHLTSSAATLVICDSAVKPKYAHFGVGDNSWRTHPAGLRRTVLCSHHRRPELSVSCADSA